MRDEYDQTEQLHPRRDQELTLSTTTVLGLFFGGVLVCAFFFGLGFVVGHWGPADHATTEIFQKAQSVLPASVASKPKPSATLQSSYERPAYSTPSATTPTAASAQPPEPSAWNAQPAMHPAQPQTASAAAPQSAQQATAPPSAGSIMVQIAAVAHEEDAAVLVSALRKRNYAVAVRRVTTDDLLHVQIGPFANRGEANAMRNKLLSDGYNASVQP